MFGVHTIEEFLARKQKGFFRIDVLAGRSVITVSRPGEPEVMTFCAIPGQVRNRKRRRRPAGEFLAGRRC